MPSIVLIRHTEISPRWAGRCYGRSDVGLSRQGREMARSVASAVTLQPKALLVSSPLRRARFLAALIARANNRSLLIEERLSECNFGTWEGKTWDAIYSETGDAMMGMITEPETFRPDGGETTFMLRDRAVAWLRSAAQLDQDVVAVCHGGPIAAIRGTLAGVPVGLWPSLAPEYGEAIEIDRKALDALTIS